MYRNYLHLLARAQLGRHLRGKVDPSDLVQEAFLTAHRSFARFRGTTEAELLVWLRRILASRMADLVRRQLKAKGRDARLERRLEDELAHSSHDLADSVVAQRRSPNAANSTSSPSQQAVRREQAVLLADALKALPKDYEEVIVLRHMEGLNFPDVARRMGRSLDSVQKLWVRALARLRRTLGTDA
jgi:RNA polymerase sigma-70 factor (ECF subfamily)